MKIDIVTLFPDMFKGPFDESILRRSQDKLLVEIHVHNLRKWTNDKRGTVDDRPYGGGAGMVMMIAPLVEAVEEIRWKKKEAEGKEKIILLSPRGKVWKQETCLEYSKLDHLILICGHYEGVDERISNFIDEEISIGDFVLTGGEIPTMVLVDSIIRLVPNVLKKPEATVFESFEKIRNSQFVNSQLLEHPQYTHPEDFRGLKVPLVLLSGNHREIEKWRKEQSLIVTKKNRPDLIK